MAPKTARKIDLGSPTSDDDELEDGGGQFEAKTAPVALERDGCGFPKWDKAVCTIYEKT
jgi:hypothetical protein